MNQIYLPFIALFCLLGSAYDNRRGRPASPIYVWVAGVVAGVSIATFLRCP